ncbi:MAG: 50S ribosomal protein L25 [Candidatus Nanopelagicales bacterium]|nr:50S ribosomal protein L25 [Candidatus Nanopelagicales bacterium]
MLKVAITASERSDFGKGAARRLRREGLVPAVLYGQGAELLHVALPAHDLDLALRRSHVVLDVTLNGTTITAKPRDIQREPVKRYIEHVDLIIITDAEARERNDEAQADDDAAAAVALEESKIH